MGHNSLLTRRVFRALTSNRSYIFAGCVRKPRVHGTFPRSSFCRIDGHQQRFIFGLSLGSNRRSFAEASLSGENVQVAMKQLVDLVRARRAQSKIPPLSGVMEAWRFLFRSHLESQRIFTRNEIYLATEVVKHFREDRDEADKPVLTEDDALLALKSLAQRDSELHVARTPAKFRSDVSELARLLFEYLQRIRQGTVQAAAFPSTHEADVLGPYIGILAATGNPGEALKAILKARAEGTISRQQESKHLVDVFEGFVRESLLTNALEVLDQVTASANEETSWKYILKAATQPDNVEFAQTVFKLYQKVNVKRRGAGRQLINLCIRNNAVELGDAAYEDMLLSEPLKEDFRAAASWLWFRRAYNTDVDQLVKDVLAAFLSGESGVANGHTAILNHLMADAYSRGDPKSAQAIWESRIGKKAKFNAITFLTQLDYFISIRDFDQAAIAYNRFASEQTPTDNRHFASLNRYIAALCFSPKPQPDQVMRLVDTLLDQGAELDSETLAGLSQMFLYKDDLEEINGLLRYRVDTLPETDRARIAAVFEQFIVDPKIEDQRAYNAYDLYRHAFPETSVHPNRMKIMQSFFGRQRPDLACLVFGHTRQREFMPHRPDAQAYAAAFRGIARTRDVDGLQMVYNMLKLDLFVEPNTHLRNAMMAAYTATHQPWSSIIDCFWKIMDSREGPTLSSFELALRACETWIPYGSLEARNVMALLQRYDIPVTKEVYDSYIGALAGNSEFENTVELIEEMEHDLGIEPDYMTIGSFYNAIPWQWRKDEVEAWAKRVFPDQWARLVECGDEIDEEWEVRYFKIDRSIDIDDGLLFGRDKEWDAEIARGVLQALEAPAR